MTNDVVAIARTVLERHSTQEGALLPILRDLQDEFGYLPEPVFPLPLALTIIKRMRMRKGS